MNIEEILKNLEYQQGDMLIAKKEEYWPKALTRDPEEDNLKFDVGFEFEIVDIQYTNQSTLDSVTFMLWDKLHEIEHMCVYDQLKELFETQSERRKRLIDSFGN